jgi:hypothetical protein
VPKWYCSIFKRISPDSCTSILERERTEKVSIPVNDDKNVQEEDMQRDL